MLEMSFSFSLNVMLSMSKTLKIDQIHLRAVISMYVEDVKDGKSTYTHIFAHNFLNIQPIFNSQKVLERSKDMQLWGAKMGNIWEQQQCITVLKHIAMQLHNQPRPVSVPPAASVPLPPYP